MGGGSRLLHIQAAQRPLRTGRRDSGGGCQQWNISARDSSGIGSAKWSSVQAHDTFSDDPGCGRSSANAVPPADDTIVLAARLALHADVGLFSGHRQPAQYYEFYNVRVQAGSVVFFSPPNSTQQPVKSPIEVFRGHRLAVDYRTAVDEGSSPLAKCARR